MSCYYCRSSFFIVLPSPTSLKGQSKCWHSPPQTAQPHTVPESHIYHKYYASWGHSGWRGRCLSLWIFPLPPGCLGSCQGGTLAPVSCCRSAGKYFLFKWLNGVVEGILRETTASPVGPLDVVRCGHLVHSQHVVERLPGGGQRALPLLLSHDASQAGDRNKNREMHI